MLTLSRVEGINGPPPLRKNKVVVGDALLFVWGYVGEPRFNLGYSL